MERGRIGREKEKGEREKTDREEGVMQKGKKEGSGGEVGVRNAIVKEQDRWKRR